MVDYLRSYLESVGCGFSPCLNANVELANFGEVPDFSCFFREVQYQFAEIPNGGVWILGFRVSPYLKVGFVRALVLADEQDIDFVSQRRDEWLEVSAGVDIQVDVEVLGRPSGFLRHWCFWG